MIDRKKKIPGFLAWLLVFVMVFGLIPVMPVAAEAVEVTELTDSTEPTEPEPTEPVGLTLEELMEKFPEGKYWNGGDPDSWTEKPCTHHGSCGKYGWNGWCGCNSFNGQSIQCMGFAEKLGFDATGYNPRVNANGWYTYSSSSRLSKLKAGDIVRRNGHSMYVIAVDGETVTIADCNAINKSCNIRWGVTISKSNLRNNFEYIRSAPRELAIGYLGKCEDYPSSGTVTVQNDTMLRTHPCDIEAYEKSEDVALVSAQTELCVTGVCKNTEDQLWYEVSYGDQKCYVKAQAVADFTADFGSVTVSDVSAPVNTKKGSGFPVKGTVSSDTLPLTKVGAYIYEGAQVTDTPYMTSEEGVSEKFTYSIYGSAVDNNLTFGKLPVGDYTYFLGAEVTNYYVAEDAIQAEPLMVRLHQNTFRVTSSSYSHSFDAGVVVNGGCLEDGAMTYTCKKCGYAYTQTLFSTGEHTLGTWETVQAPTCTEEGRAIQSCMGCDLTNEKTLPATNHLSETPVYTAPTCTEMGYTTLFCADCGAYLYDEDYEAALGHSYLEGVVTKNPTLSEPGQQQQVCTRCDHVALTEIACLTGGVEGWSLTLGGDLSMNFNLEIAEDIRDTAQVVITVAEETYSYPVSNIRQQKNSETYRFSVPVSAAQMTDPIRVQVVNGEDVGQIMEYTILQYAQAVLSDESLSSSHDLIREMLAYGAAAQVYFDYNVDDLADQGIGHTGNAPIPQAWEEMTVTGNAEGIRFYGASLVYRDKIAVRYYFVGSDEVAQMSFQADGQSYTPVEKDGLWYVEIPGILIQDLDENITLAVNNSLFITYCPMHYVIRMNQKGTQAAKALLNAMYNYHLAAEEYLNTRA